MISQKKTKPAIAQTMNGPRDSSSLGSGLDQSNTPSLGQPQAPLPPDNRGESDWEYFRARPGVATRTRLPFPREYPDDFLEYGGGAAFLHIAVTRDRNGEPTWCDRRLQFCEGGSA
jgi:hypothetical protein